LRGGGLEPGGPGDGLRPGVRDHQVAGQVGERCEGVAADQHGAGASQPRHAQRTGHVGRAAAGRDPDRDVRRRHRAGVPGTQSGVVLGVLDGRAERLAAAGVVRDEHAFEPERRDDLRGVQHGHPPGRAGAEVVHPPAGAHALHDLVDHEGERRQCAGDRAGDRRVLGVEQPQHILGWHGVDVGSPRVTLLGARGGTQRCQGTLTVALHLC
jgi:hypothetical protein